MAPTAITLPTGPPKNPPSTKIPSSTTTTTAATETEPHPTTSPTQTPSTDPIPPLQQTLLSPTIPLALRFRALFTLKHHASLPFPPPNPTSLPAIHAIASALTSPSASALLKHELAYCLGQTGNLAAVEPLRRLLADRREDAMCRHEAAEALGALGDEGSVGLLRECLGRGGEEEVVVRETCELALRRIEWVHGPEGKAAETGRLGKSDFLSVDPAPSAVPMLSGEKKGGKEAGLTVAELGERLMRRELALFDRYRAMFALRDLASPPDRSTAVEAVEALARGLGDESALFRHEIAFVFGQLCHPASVPCLKECLARREEMSMVRHEAAEALGSLGEEEGVEEFLRGFLDDPEEVVRESIIVALDMAEEGREFGNEAQEDFASRHKIDGL